MKAGEMKYKLTLLKPQKQTDKFGSEKVVYEDAGTVWAERKKQSGYRSEEVGEHFPDYRAEFNIRDAHTVAENWRVKQLGGHLYTVTSIVPNLNRGMLTLTCERVNE